MAIILSWLSPNVLFLCITMYIYLFVCRSIVAYCWYSLYCTVPNNTADRASTLEPFFFFPSMIQFPFRVFKSHQKSHKRIKNEGMNEWMAESKWMNESTHIEGKYEGLFLCYSCFLFKMESTYWMRATWTERRERDRIVRRRDVVIHTLNSVL